MSKTDRELLQDALKIVEMQSNVIVKLMEKLEELESK